jgi:hypothetical protein
MKATTVLIAVFLSFLCGCRREDIREYTFDVPYLRDEASKNAAISALSKYGGVDKSSYKFNFDKKTLTLKYDSMQIARTNIRMALESAAK